MKVWPVKKFTAGSSSAKLRCCARKLYSESRISTSISPECEHREAHLRRRADELHLVGRAEHGVGDGAAVGDVEALPLAGGVLVGVAGDAGVDAADELAAAFHRCHGRAFHVLRGSRVRQLQRCPYREGAQSGPGPGPSPYSANCHDPPPSCRSMSAPPFEHIRARSGLATHERCRGLGLPVEACGTGRRRRTWR